MIGKSHESAPGPGRRPFSRQSVTSVMNSIGTVWVFVLLILINMDIAGRAVFNHPIRGVPEIVSISIVALVFIQIAHTLSVGRLTRSEVFLAWLGRNYSRAGHLLEGLFHLVGTGLFVIIFWASLPMFINAWRIKEYVGAEGDFKAPVWPVKLIILLGCLAAGLQFLILAVKHFRQAAAQSKQPEGDRR